MSNRYLVRLLCAATALATAGCAAVDPSADYRLVDERVRAALGADVSPRFADDAQIAATTDALLADGLTADEALQLSLLNNPGVRAAYARVGIARADVVQAGLFSNPTLSIALRFPDGGGLSNIELAVAQSIAELWLLPVRKRAAEGELQREILVVAREISRAALDARAAYFEALAAERAETLARESGRVAQELLDAAVARQQAGVGSEIDVNLARTELMQTEVGARRAAQATAESRLRLAAVLGLRDAADGLKLAGELPEPPHGGLDAERLAALAETTRLDLVAAGYVVRVAEARVEQEQLSVFADVEVGLSVERDARNSRGDRPWLADTAWATAEAGELAAPSLRPRERVSTDVVLGPTLSLKLPIFDQNQAQIAKARHAHEAACAGRDALLVEVLQETRAAAGRAQASWDVARYYRDRLLPLADESLGLAREAYRSGKLSLLAVLEAQKSLLAARERYLEALREGIVALIQLEKAVGLPAESLLTSPARTTATAPLEAVAGADQP
ncbi:MAG: TolC family protein [Phycisphaerales bacterium]|nr:TolC family protein [Phycisphaerales bacterium]